MKMKVLITMSFVMLLTFVTALGSQDAVQELEEDEKERVSTWKRGDKVILIVSSSKSKDPKITVQQIMFNGKRVMTLVELDGKLSFTLEPENSVVPGVDFDEKGKIIGVALYDKSRRLVETYKATDNVLSPVMGTELDQIQSLTSDVGELFDRKNFETKSHDEWLEEAAKVVRKHKKEEAQQGGAGQPATAVESKPEGKEEPKTKSEVRSQ